MLASICLRVRSMSPRVMMSPFTLATISSITVISAAEREPGGCYACEDQLEGA